MEVTEECDICGKGHSPEACPELNHISRDVINTSRARATLPSQFVDVNTNDNTVDIVAVTDITSKYHLGTFEANRTTKPIGGPNDFVLQIMLKGSGSAVWLDTRDENKCNWLCLIAVAATAEEKNVMALQVGLDIIYLTTREIHTGEALRVWYAPSYAKKINKPIQPDGLTKSMLIMSTHGNLSNGDEPRQLLCSNEPSGSKAEMSQPSNINRMEEKLSQKLRAAPLCGKGIYVCAYPGCALIFPTQQRLDEHCQSHHPNAGHTSEMDLLMEDLKSENVHTTSAAGGILQDVSKTSWPIFHAPTATTSTLDLIINPRALRICHQASSGEQQCRHCDKVFNSVEELAVHVKQHIFKGVGRKRKRQNKSLQSLASDNDSDIDVISLNPPRKSGRSRKNKFLHDPDFVYVCETTGNTQRVKQTAGSSDGGQNKHSGEGEPTVKRKRGRPPKRQRPNMTTGQKHEDATKITDDKCGPGQCTSGQTGDSDKTVSDKNENDQPLHGQVDRLTQSESMICFEGTQGIDIKGAIKNEGISLNGDVIPCEEVAHSHILIKSEIMNAGQDLTKEKDVSENEENHRFVHGRSEEFWQGAESADWQQQNLAQSGDILVIGEQNLNIESCDEVPGQYALDKDSQALTEGQCDLAVIDYIQGEGQDPAANVDKLDAENKPEMDGENLDAAIEKMEGGVNQNLEEARAMGDWNPNCLRCDGPVDGSVKSKQEVTHFTSDHGNYSMKSTDGASILSKSDVDPDSTAVVTNADSLFTSTNLVPTIVNLDDMDVITGESLSVEVKGECPDGEKVNEGKAIINENKTHYLCVACQVERPLVSIKELHDHLYTHIGISKCPRCEELFVKVDEHECKASTKSSSTEDQPVKDSDVSEDSDMLKCYEVKNDKFVCGICKRLFHKEAHLVMHLKRHNNSRVCEKCNRMFTSDDQLQNHKCEKADLNAGSPEAKEEKSHFCEFCGASYKKRQYLLLHMATHTKEHKCEKCGVHFARKETLMKHWTKCMPEAVAKKDVFPCMQCSRVFTKELSLQNHILTVHTESFVCEKCKTVFSSMFSLKRHACMQQMEGKFECTICPKVFRRRLYLKRHMAIHSGKFTCILCQQHYARKEELLKHTLECSASIQFETTGTIKCTVCDKVYTDVHAYRIHYQDHTHPYKCDVCNKPFLRPMALEAHKKNCKPYEGDPFVCSICNRKFRSQIYLLRHKQVHDEKKYTCKRCNRKFRRIDYLNNHMCVDKDGRQVLNMQCYKKEELVTKDVCVCPHCGKTFQTTSNLNKHILLHGEKKEVCEVCGKKFHLKVGLREHMKYVHTDQYLIECQVCKKRLKSRNSLYGHMAVYHSDIDTVYPCEECGKTFRQKGNLKKHMLVHSENRLFSCKQCNKKFKFPEQLRRHELWHATGPRFFCDLCDKAFVMEFEIKKHLNTIHGGLTYICCFCDTDCHHFYSMKRHLQRRHMDKPKWQESVNEFIRGLAVQTVTVVTGDGKISNSKKTQSQLGSSVKKLFRCGFCKQIFQQQQELQAHLIENHCKLHKFHCAYCTHTCTEQQAMHKHLQSEHADIQEWQNDPDLYIKHLQDTSSQLAETKFAPESRSLLRDLSILKDESDVEGINPFSMTTETLDTQGILSQTMVSMATDLLGNVHQTLPQIDSLPLQGTESIGDMTDMSLDIGQEPVIVAEVKDFCARESNSSQTIIIKGDSQDIELSGLLPQEVAEALQSLSVQGGFTGIPVTLSSDNNDQGLIILPVMEQMSEEVQLTELQNNLKPQLDDISSEQLPQEANDEMKCEL